MSQLEFNTEAPDGRTTLFADVILPVPIPRMFTYRVPYELNDSVAIGCRVIVQFGNRKILTGIIGGIHETPPEVYEAKLILEQLDVDPVVNPIQIELFKWIADYYMCTLGEVLNMALPSGLKLSSESKVQLHPEFDFYESSYEFSDHEESVIMALEKNESLSYTDISKLLGQKTIYSIIKSLVFKQAVIIYEEIKEKYKPKKQKRIRLAKGISDKLEGVFESLSTKPKQEAIILAYLQLVPIYNKPELNEQGTAKSELMTADLSTSSLSTLVKNGILEEFEIIVSRFEDYKEELKEINLTPLQENTKDKILNGFEVKSIQLLHGITGSGKTEIYIRLIEHVIEAGSQVLYLLPEIALTTQIVTRLRKIFGDKLGVYHSKFSDNERVEVWNGVLSEKYQVVVGVRSAIFLPFDNLGLIIVDEEHESSYKQYEPAPRYNARDAAMVMANLHHSKVLLGSATPSLESYYQALEGKYGLVELLERYGEASLPEFEMADMLNERSRKLVRGEFSSILIKAMESTLQAGKQSIIFKNRRGYSPYLSCQQCGWIPKCTNCAVSLTYHQYKNQIICHYCGYKEPVPSDCQACGSTNMKTVGFGTEKLEEEIELFLPDASVQRMDLETTRKKHSYDTIISDFQEGKVDILVGTQMVTKGLDFDNVSLVGIVDLDRMLHFPDFRSSERTFQLVTQVSGRAGRRKEKGRVVIQTSNTKQYILEHITNHNFKSFYNQEIAERNTYHYPPFTRLINIVIKHKDKETARIGARKLYNLIAERLGHDRLLGPQEPVINRIRNEYLMEILVKLERQGINISKVKSIIQELSSELQREKELKSLKIIFDVDPY